MISIQHLKYSLLLMCWRFMVIFGECMVGYIAVRLLHNYPQQCCGATVSVYRLWRCCCWNFPPCKCWVCGTGMACAVVKMWMYLTISVVLYRYCCPLYLHAMKQLSSLYRNVVSVAADEIVVHKRCGCHSSLLLSSVSLHPPSMKSWQLLMDMLSITADVVLCWRALPLS